MVDFNFNDLNIYLKGYEGIKIQKIKFCGKIVTIIWDKKFFGKLKTQANILFIIFYMVLI